MLEIKPFEHTVSRRRVSLGDFKLNDFAVIACFNVVRISGKKPDTFLSEVEKKERQTLQAHIPMTERPKCKFPMRMSANRPSLKTPSINFCVRETRLHNEL